MGFNWAAAAFERSVDGPLLLGDGRFLGLGVMAPNTHERSAIYAFRVEPASDADLLALSRALRRAVMARAQEVLGTRKLERFSSGHEEDGSPATAGTHLAFHFDPVGQRLLVTAPEALERSGASSRFERNTIERALDGFTELRAGSAGILRPRAIPISDDDSIVRASRVWASLTPYSVTRHAKGKTAGAALVEDVLAECVRRVLPRPQVRVLNARGIPGRWLSGSIELTFPSPVRGPVVLGRSRYLGGGLFASRDDEI
jgi:CRISPR-associated protein Csb2